MKKDTTKPISTIKKDTDGTITFTITLPTADVQKATEIEIDKAVQYVTVPGFRQGKAPKNVAINHINFEKVREEVLKKLLPDAYSKAVSEHNIKPIINPKIHVENFEEGKDWVFTASTCEMPEVALNDYKDAIKNITVKSKIVIPGKEPQQPNFDDIVKVLLDKITVTVPKILVEGEVERLLSQLLSEIKSLGLSLDQYIASTGKSIESLKSEYQTKAENDIKFEFALQKIAEVEKIAVNPEEVEEALKKAKDDTERKQLESNVYLLASILRQQKTLDFLKNL